MANNNYFELPDLIELNSFGGDFHAFLEFVYNEFKKEFIDKLEFDLAILKEQKTCVSRSKVRFEKKSCISRERSNFLAHDIRR